MQNILTHIDRVGNLLKAQNSIADCAYLVKGVAIGNPDGVASIIECATSAGRTVVEDDRFTPPDPSHGVL